jgi:aquaporin NIP
MKRYLAEYFATAFMLFCILYCIDAVKETSPWVSLTAASAVAGIAVWLMIVLLGKVSGAHMNPAVSTAMYFDNELRFTEYLGYVIAQLGGSFTAAFVFDKINGDVYYLMGATEPTINVWVAWMFEFVLTFALLMVIYRFTDKRFPGRNKWAAVAIGAIVFLEIMIAGPYCGASMNPARSFGPAIVKGEISFLWIYFGATVAGAIAARYFDLRFRAKAD